MTAALVLLPVSLVLGASAGSAQTNGTGSSIGPCTPPNSTVDLGTFAVGAVIRARLSPICVWDQGTSVTVVVNGQTVGTKVADAAGGIPVSITVVSNTQLSVDDPVAVPANCGINTVSGSGASSAAQTTAGATATFTVQCVAAVVTTSKGGLAFTGADIARWAAIALALVVIGALMMRTVRRRRNP